MRVLRICCLFAANRNHSTVAGCETPLMRKGRLRVGFRSCDSCSLTSRIQAIIS